MIAVEVILAILVAAVVITGIMKIAGPIADAFADRLKLKFQELGPEQERQFKERIESLEQQVRELQTQVGDLRDAIGFIEQIDQAGLIETKIDLKNREKREHK